MHVRVLDKTACTGQLLTLVIIYIAVRHGCKTHEYIIRTCQTISFAHGRIIFNIILLLLFYSAFHLFYLLNVYILYPIHNYYVI